MSSSKTSFRTLLRASAAAVLGLVLGTGLAQAQAGYVLTPAAEVSADFKGQKLVTLGDHYYVGGERIDLYRRADQLVVQLAPQPDPDQAFESLASDAGPLAGFRQVRQFDNGMRLLQSDELASPSRAGLSSYASLRDTLATLSTRQDVAFAVPVFVNASLGSYAVASDELLVRLKPGVEAEDFFADARFGAYERAPASDAYLVKVKAGAGEAVLALASALRSSPRIVWAEPNFYEQRQKFFTPDDPLFADQWHLDNTGQGFGTPGADARLVSAWDVAPGAPGLVIAIVDDGPEITHEDLVAYVNPNEIPGNGVDDDNNGHIDDVSGWDFTSNDNNGGPSSANDTHGTSVAGVAAGRGNNGIGVTGAAYQATVFPARIFNGNTATSNANIGAALAYSAGRFRSPGTTNWRGADVINNSWGGGASASVINDALTWGSTNGRGGLGALYFFATGNDGSTTVSYPANLAGTIAGVMAVGASNNFDLHSTYSQSGAQIDFVAPSDGGLLAITTVDRTGAPGYNNLANQNYTSSFGGTSSATPLASGIAALLLSVDPTITPARARALMRGTADKIGPNAYVNGFNTVYGYGRLNAAQVVRSVNAARVGVRADGQAVTSGAVLSREVPAGTAFSLTFVVQAVGELSLTLADLDVDGDAGFSIGADFGATSLNLGQSTTFEVDFSSLEPGAYTADVTFSTNDVDHPTFTIPLEFEVIPVSIGGAVFEDWNADTTRNEGDLPLSGMRVYLDADGDSTYDPPSTLNPIDSATPLNVAFGDYPRPNPTSDTLTVAGQGEELQQLEVRVSLTHTWVGDVSLRLEAPDGRRVLLVDAPGGGGNSGDNMTNTVFADDATMGIQSGAAPYTGRFRPQQPLSTLYGINPNGTWRLIIGDSFPGDNGNLVSWSLRMATDGERSQVTSSDGSHSFIGLPAGVYTLRAAAPQGWNVTAPVGGSHVVTVVSDENSLGHDFGLVRQNSIYGKAYADLDADGSFDEGADLGLEGEAVLLDRNGNGVLDPPTTYSVSNNTPIAIPDNSAAVNSTIAASQAGLVTSVTVSLNITHTFVGDLEVTLTSPGGTGRNLIMRRGGSGDNFTNTVLDDAAATSITTITGSGAPFTGSYRPEQPLSGVAGEPITGDWVLSVRDRAGGDTGTLNSWTLNFQVETDFSTSTNEWGNYRFDGIVGDTSVSFDVPVGFSVTEPADGVPEYELTVAAGQTANNIDFGVGSGGNVPPVVDDQSFNVLAGSPNGTVVGTIVATDANGGDALAITGTGGTGAAFFAVAANGEITVTDNAGLTEGSSYTLTVSVSDGEAVDTAVITIDVVGFGIFGNGFEAD